MSEHTPITGELREAVEWEPTFCGPDKAMVPQPEFDRICDAIDAVHAQLERENAELRERLAVLDNRSESMHDGGRITDELRAWWVRDGKESLLAIADRIDVEHDREMIEIRTRGWSNGYDEGFASADDWLADHEDAMAEHGWVRLPVDADGETIHVGDVLDGYGKTIEVVELRHGRSGWVLISRDGNGYADCAAFAHHHAPTVEDVLREMHAELDEVTALYVGEAIDSDERDRDEARIFAEYAKRLTLAGDAE